MHRENQLNVLVVKSMIRLELIVAKHFSESRIIRFSFFKLMTMTRPVRRSKAQTTKRLYTWPS